ncbi:MAG: hypothetical protein JST86_20745 [Bacteroidetes bacterium]|nr:hypothetical protein [Bacteroidota bacterium]
MKKFSPVLFCMILLLTAVQASPLFKSTGQCKIVDDRYILQDTGWVTSLNAFRKAVVSGNKAAVKKYFEFPVKNFGNEIWKLVLTEKEIEAKHLYGGTIIPFSETDFDQYCTKLFPDAFNKSMQLINTSVLKRKNETASPLLKQSEKVTYKMYVSYDDETKTITLNLGYKTKGCNPADKAIEVGENNVLYYFSVKENGSIIFKEVRLAG